MSFEVKDRLRARRVPVSPSRVRALTGAGVALLAVGLAGWGGGSAPTSTSSSAGHTPCARAGSATLLENRAVRVYATRRGGAIKYACLKATNRRIKLDGPIDVTTRPPPAMALAGPVLLTVTDLFLDLGDAERVDSSLGIRDMRVEAGRLRRSPVATTRPRYGALGVGSPQLKKNGSFALVYIIRGGNPPSKVVKYEVRAPRRRVVLDSGRQIDPSSLRLRDSRLSWRSGGQTKFASLR